MRLRAWAAGLMLLSCLACVGCSTETSCGGVGFGIENPVDLGPYRAAHPGALQVRGCVDDVCGSQVVRPGTSTASLPNPIPVGAKAMQATPRRITLTVAETTGSTSVATLTAQPVVVVYNKGQCDEQSALVNAIVVERDGQLATTTVTKTEYGGP